MAYRDCSIDAFVSWREFFPSGKEQQPFIMTESQCNIFTIDGENPQSHYSIKKGMYAI